MRSCSSRCVWLMFISLSLLPEKCEGDTASEHFQTQTNNSSLCLNGFMSVYLPKEQFPDLPFSIYVEDEDGGYFQAVAIAKQCHYFIGESGDFVVLTVSSDGCFVKRQKYVSSVTVVIVAPADDRVDVVESIRLVCQVKDTNKEQFLPENTQIFCSKDGFNITISQNATVPPLNLDLVWIPSGLNLSCKPQKTSKDVVTFSFPFTDCGVQSVVSGEIVTYWVDIVAKQRLHNASIIRDTPFHLTVNCSFTLTQMTRLDVDVQSETFEFPSALKSKGTFRTEMRFAKDSSYQSFFSPRERPTVTELGQSVYVEVFVVKHEDGDLTLLLDDCWATPTHNTRDPQRWMLLVKGCPFSGDSHRTVVVSRKEVTHPSLYKRFVVKLFSFIKPSSPKSEVYFHCDVKICKGPDCSQSCSNGGRQLRRVKPGQMIPPGVVSAGPLLYLL